MQQIDDLQVYLEEERYNHKNTKLQVINNKKFLFKLNFLNL